MKKIIVLIDPVSAGINLIDAALETSDYIAVYTLGKERVMKYVDTLQEIEKTALQVIYSESTMEVLEKLDDKYLDRIVSVIPASEPGVVLASSLAKKLGLIHLNEKSTIICRDKTQVREELKGLSLPTIGFGKCESYDDCLTFVDHHQLPVVVKHPTGAGQNNIFICQDLKELELAFDTIITSPNLFGQMTSVVLVEEYLDGEEYAVNFLVSNKIIRKLDTWRYEHYLFDEKNRLYDNITHYRKNHYGQDQVEAYAESAIAAFGIDNGFIHLEVIDDKVRGPILVDIGARLIGGHFTTLIKKLGIGDPFQVALKLYDGTLNIEDIKYDPKVAMTGVFLPIYKTGTIKEIKGIEEIKKRQGYSFHFCSLKPGQEIERSQELGNMAATFYFSAPKDSLLRGEINFIRETFEIVYS
ncbi:MAG: hypothetical protein ACI9XP_000717 [Lentimonas sp.]|jgi:hypothetical protein